MDPPEYAPPLPREPTLLRVSATTTTPSTTPSHPESVPPLPPVSSVDMPANPQASVKRSAKDLPLPPRFPSMKDVGTVWSQEASSPELMHSQNTDDSLQDVAWMRTSAEPVPPTPNSTNSPSAVNPDFDMDIDDDIEPDPNNHPTDIQPVQKPSFVTKIMGLFRRPRSKPAQPLTVTPTNAPQVTPAASTKDKPSPSALVRAKTIIRQLPDPTLAFVFEACVMLLLHSFCPHILKTWAARLLAPAVLVPTVAASALWRRTSVVALPGHTVLNAVKPIPNATKIVAQGEQLRARETALIRAEDDLRNDQLRLEMLRSEIEVRLPPQISIASMVEQERERNRKDE